jgi:iron complex outermembrane receptor protein
MKIKMKLRWTLMCSVTIMATAGIAQAQETAPPSASSGLEEIVVTAQRRSEKMQDVPITVNAVTANALRSAEIRSTVDLTFVVPGLRANVQSGYFQPFIRGIGGSSSLPGNESPVALYIDGVYVGMKEANTFELNNIERIEVLKGPQGTLFGRNATGGAISIITKAPSSTLEANFDASYGRFEDVIANGYLSGPISDTLTASVSLRYQNIGKGYARNIVTGTDFATLNSFSAMGKLMWEPTPEFTVTGEFIYTKRRTIDDEQGTPNAAITPKGARVPGAIVSYTPYEVSLNSDPRLELNDKKYILNARYDLGPVKLVSITGYNHGDSLSEAERDRSSAFQQFTAANGVARQFTQEIQLQSDTDSRLSWILGGYYFDTREGYAPFTTLLNIPGAFTLPALAAAFGRTGASAAQVNASQYAKSLAGFAEATYEFLPDTRITAGFRYTTEKRHLVGTRDLVTVPPPGNAFVFTRTANLDLETRFSRPTWRITLDHHFTPDIMAYASYNRGFRSGAYNPSSITPAGQVPLNPEMIDAYELGLKTEFFGNRLRFNVAGFYYDYRDIHVSVRTPSTGVIVQQNAGGAEVYGVDIDFAVQPTRRFTLSGGVNLLHARYSDYDNASTFVIDPVNAGGVQVTIPSAKGQPLAYAPEVTANLNMTYDLPLANDSRLSVQGNYFITSSFSRQVGVIRGREEVQGYDSLNASVTWHSPRDEFFVRAWGRNLTNHKILGSTLDSFAYFYVVQRPITYGMSFGFKFGG